MKQRQLYCWDPNYRQVQYQNSKIMSNIGMVQYSDQYLNNRQVIQLWGSKYRTSIYQTFKYWISKSHVLRCFGYSDVWYLDPHCRSYSANYIFPGFPWSNYIEITFIMLIILLQISKLTVKSFKDVCGVFTSTRVGRYANP